MRLRKLATGMVYNLYNIIFLGSYHFQITGGCQLLFLKNTHPPEIGFYCVNAELLNYAPLINHQLQLVDNEYERYLVTLVTSRYIINN